MSDKQQLQQQVAQSAKALIGASQELQQLSLLDEIAFEPEVALPVEEIKKRFTGTNGDNIAARRAQVVKMLAYSIPVKVICDVLKMSHHTVAAIAAQETQAIAAFSEVQAEALAADAMADIAVARTKRDEASYKDLHIAAGIKLTHAQSLKLLGAGSADPTPTTIEAEDPRRLAFVERLKQIMRAPPEPDKPETESTTATKL